MTNDAEARPIDPSTVRHLDRRLGRIQRDARAAVGPSAGIVRDGRLVWGHAVGTLDGRVGVSRADLDTQYRMGSITKPFVAVAVMRLRDAGLLDLEDRFEEHVPGSQVGRATIAHLLSHAAGIQAETNGPWWERTPGAPWDEPGRVTGGPAVPRGPAVPLHERRVRRARRAAGSRARCRLVRGRAARPARAARHGPHDDPAIGQGGARLGGASVRRRCSAEPEHDAVAMGPAGRVDDRGRTSRRGPPSSVVTRATCSPATPSTRCWSRTWSGDNPGQPWTSAHGLGWQVWNIEGRRLAGHGGSMPGFLAGLRVDLESGGRAGCLHELHRGAFGPQVAPLLTEFMEREPKSAEPWHAG